MELSISPPPSPDRPMRVTRSKSRAMLEACELVCVPGGASQGELSPDLTPVSPPIQEAPMATPELSQELAGVFEAAEAAVPAPGAEVVVSEPLGPPAPHCECACCTMVFHGPRGPRDLAGHLRVDDASRCVPNDAQVEQMQQWVSQCPHCHQFYSKTGLRNHINKCPAIRNLSGGSDQVLPPIPDSDIGAFGDIPSMSWDWVDSVDWDDTVFFGQTLVPNSVCKDYWLFVQSICTQLLAVRPHTAMKLHVMSAQMVLCAPRTDWEHSVNQWVKERASRFCRGEFEALYTEARRWDSGAAGRGRKSDEHSENDKVMKALLRAKDGRAKAAVQALMSGGLLDPSDSDIQEHLAKQYTPVFEPPVLPEEPGDFDSSDYLWNIEDIEVEVLESDGGPPPKVNACDWVKSSLPRHRVADQFGWRYEHYKCMEEVSVRDWVLLFYRAQFPEESYSVIASAVGFCIDKGGRVPRGVHSVMVLRKVAERVAMLQDRELIGEDMVKVGQFGIALPGGVEYVYHCNRLAVLAAFDGADPYDEGSWGGLGESMQQPCALQTDFEGAFPNVFQSKIVEGLEQHPNGLYKHHAKYARMLYSKQTMPKVIFRGSNGSAVHTEKVVSGCHQGSPASTFHFGVAIRPLCASLQSIVSNYDAMCSWIVDDCSFAGSLEGSYEAAKFLHAHSQEYGLRLKANADLGKTKLKAWTPCASRDFIREADSDHGVEGLFTELKRDHFAISRHGVKRVLGAPLSLDSNYVRPWVEKRVADNKLLLERISVLDHPQTEWLLLKYCGATRQSHLCRLLHPDDVLFPLLDLDTSMRKCFDHVVGGAVSDDQWIQVKLPVRHGGCGLSNPVLIRSAAALSSARSTAQLLARVNEANNLSFYSSMLKELQRQPHLKEASSELIAKSVEVGVQDESFLPPLSALHDSRRFPSQRSMSSVLHLGNKKQLLDKFLVENRQLAAWFRSCGEFGSGQWLNAVATLDCFKAKPEVFQVMFMLRIGMLMPHASSEEIPRCPCSPHAVHSQRIQSGSHFMTSCKMGPLVEMRNERHHELRDSVYAMSKEAGVQPRHRFQHEPQGLAGGWSRGKPADVQVEAAVEGGKDRALDVCVADPRSAGSMHGGAADASLVAARRMSERKLNEYKAHLNSYGAGIIPVTKVPLPVEASGAWGAELKAYWKELKTKHRLLKKENYIRAGLPHTHTAFTFCQFWPQKISFGINRATAHMVLEGLHRSRKFVSLVA